MVKSALSFLCRVNNRNKKPAIDKCDVSMENRLNSYNNFRKGKTVMMNC